VCVTFSAAKHGSMRLRLGAETQSTHSDQVEWHTASQQDDSDFGPACIREVYAAARPGWQSDTWTAPAGKTPHIFLACDKAHRHPVRMVDLKLLLTGDITGVGASDLQWKEDGGLCCPPHSGIHGAARRSHTPSHCPGDLELCSSMPGCWQSCGYDA
jgi:hypothetical protein